MFDPTIFENLKVVLEGEIYDLDLANEINIINRKDLIDMAAMSRSYSIQLQLNNQQHLYPFLDITLSSTINDFALEKIEENEQEAGCKFDITYYTKVHSPETECVEIANYINQVWNKRPIIKQEISYFHGDDKNLINKVLLDFGRKINEDHIDDLPVMIDLAINVLDFLSFDA